MSVTVPAVVTAPPERETLRLEADSLVKRYGGRTVVGGVSFNLERGEIVALLGPNGAGKTTSFYMMVGFVRPNSGRITLGGETITGWPMYKTGAARSGLLGARAERVS